MFEDLKKDIIGIKEELSKLSDYEKRLTDLSANTQKEIIELESIRNNIKTIISEKTRGFPWLVGAIADYFYLQSNSIARYLENKRRPAHKTADQLREQAQLRREAETKYRVTKYLLEYYESIAPFLLDFKNELADVNDAELFREYSEEERLDPVINYVSKDEYRQLSSVEKNQRALDRFWQRPKSKWLLGRIYERYIGYLFEQEGYDVDYVGIFKGFEDLGRDLICKKGNRLVVVQCKYWAQFRTIYEKHIFQFFGTVFYFKDENPNSKVIGMFYTSTRLSDLARRFARELGIELKEEFKFDNTYPSIKCNISRINGAKIYHLPFDQQYDKVKIEKDVGEFYCATVKEAEEKGFRRAFRWQGE